MDHDREPVFRRSQWGTQRYYYNPRNPIGLTLIIVSLLFAGTMMLLMANRTGPFAPEPAPTWSVPPDEYAWPPVSGNPAPWTSAPATSTTER